MILKIRTSLLIVFFLIVQQFGNAQPTSNMQFLKKVGILDSIQSNILNESRKIYIQIPESINSDKNRKYPLAFILDGEIFLPTLSDVHNYYSGGFMPEKRRTSGLCGK